MKKIALGLSALGLSMDDAFLSMPPIMASGPRTRVDYVRLGDMVQTRRGQGTYQGDRFADVSSRMSRTQIGMEISPRTITLAARDPSRSKYVPHVPSDTDLLKAWGEAPNGQTRIIAKAVLKRRARFARNLAAVQAGGMIGAAA